MSTIPSRFDEDENEARILGAGVREMTELRKTNNEYSFVFFFGFPSLVTNANCFPSGENTANPFFGRTEGYPLPAMRVIRMVSATVTGRLSALGLSPDKRPARPI